MYNAAAPSFLQMPRGQSVSRPRPTSQSIRSSNGDGSSCADKGKSSKGKCVPYILFSFLLLHASLSPIQSHIRSRAKCSS